MKNKNGKIIFWALACVLTFSLGSPAKAADNHSHFEAEKVKAGVKFFESYRTQAAIDRDASSDGQCAGSTVNGFPNHPYYNPSREPYIDGAIIPIVKDMCLAQLRNRFTSILLEGVGGKVYVQFEGWMDQDLMDDGPFTNWSHFKFFRLYNEDRIGDCVTVETMNFGTGCASSPTRCDGYGMHGDHCGSLVKSIIWPGQGNKWVRFTWLYDAGNNRMTVWQTNIATGTSETVMDYTVPNLSAGAISGAWPLLHSTERNHNGSDPREAGYTIGYRNIIVSTQPIAFSSGTSGSAFCGDGSCNGTETCSTCPGDCGTCAGSDTTAPSVTAFSISPTTLTVGSAITASYTVTDNTALAKAELWQAPFNSTLCSDTTKTGCAWTLVNSANISGTSKSGTLSHTPSATGVFFYGLHAIDASGNIGTESSPIKVTVNAQSAVCGDNACNGTETCSTCPGDCGACTTGSSLLIDFESTHVFGLANWTTLLKDQYTNYVDLGPGGMTITAGSNASYNYQGVQGSSSIYFAKDDRIIATWYNAGTSSITFTPYVSFNDPDRRLSDTAGNWYLMSALTLSPGQTGTTQYILDQATAGSHPLVNINANYSNYRELICDKIEYKSSATSSGTPGDLNSDGKVDIFDYSLFISDFGKTGTGLAADLNSDGKVDIFDYSMFISNFGK